VAKDRTRVIGALDDGLSQRQQAVLDAIRASHPRPVVAAQLAARLAIAEGALNITLRSLHRRGLIAPAPPTPRQHGGWTASHAT
jgi:DNA-binding MarR family transcriptional regulator